MQIEVIIVAIIVFGIMTITGQISINQLISDNQMLFMKFVMNLMVIQTGIMILNLMLMRLLR